VLNKQRDSYQTCACVNNAALFVLGECRHSQ